MRLPSPSRDDGVDLALTTVSFGKKFVTQTSQWNLTEKEKEKKKERVRGFSTFNASRAKIKATILEARNDPGFSRTVGLSYG